MKFVKTSDGNVGAFVDGRTYSIASDSMHYDGILTALKNDDKTTFGQLVAAEDTLDTFCNGHIDFKYGLPRWQGVPMPDLFADRIIELVQEGHEFEPMMNFLANLSENPEDHSIIELIDFLSNKNLPVTKDGCFLGYKAVSHDFTDIHSGTFDNSIGNVVEMNRDSVDHNRNKHCSSGLHVGALDYVTSYGCVDKDDYGPGDDDNRIVIVKVNPKDVITVPNDCSFQKLRCCKYEVVAEFTGVLDEAVYDDAEHFKNKTAFVTVKRKGWKSKLKERFSRIASLINSKRKVEYVR